MFFKLPLSGAVYTGFVILKTFLEKGKTRREKKKSDYGKNWMIKEKRCFSTK